MAPVMRQAIVAVEDGRFYEHRGVDPRGLIRAFVGNASGGTAAAGGGGSTLTQQYVKNVFVETRANSPEEAAGRDRAQHHAASSRRCATPWRWRRRSPRTRSSSATSTSPTSAPAPTASRPRRCRYFSKHASKLTLVEAATLAGAVQQPVAYDPTRNPKSSQKRRIQVLDRMAELGYITPRRGRRPRRDPDEEVPQAEPHGATAAPRPTRRSSATTSTASVRTDPAFGATPAEREALLRRGGLTIRTTLDPAAQKAAQKAVDKYIPRKDKSRKLAAITMVRPDHRRDRRDGAEPLVGRARVAATRRTTSTSAPKDGGSLGAQAGSTFKAFTLAAALQQGLSPYEHIEAPQTQDVQRTSRTARPARSSRPTGSTTPPAPARSTCSPARRSRSTPTSWRSRRRSASAPPAAIADGRSACAGATARRSTACPSFTLGTDEVTPLAMAGAYATFANHGIRCAADRDRARDRPRRQGPRRPAGRLHQGPRPQGRRLGHEHPEPGHRRPAARPHRRGRCRSAATPPARPVRRTTRRPCGSSASPRTSPRPSRPTTRAARNGYPMKNLTIGGRYYAQVFGSTLPGPIWKDAMEAALEDDARDASSTCSTLDGLGAYVPPPPKPTATPSPAAARARRQRLPERPRAHAEPAPAQSPSPRSRPSPSPLRPRSFLAPAPAPRARPLRRPDARGRCAGRRRTRASVTASFVGGHTPSGPLRFGVLPDGALRRRSVSRRGRFDCCGHAAAVGSAGDARGEDLHDLAHRLGRVGAGLGDRLGDEHGELVVGRAARAGSRRARRARRARGRRARARGLVVRRGRLAALLGLAAEHRRSRRRRSARGPRCPRPPRSSPRSAPCAGSRSVTSSRARMAAVRSSCRRCSRVSHAPDPPPPRRDRRLAG